MGRKTLEERFWAKVDKRGPDECWEWVGAKNSGGYGSIRDGEKTVHAHRISWELHNRSIPGGLWVLHHCDNRGCVNPEHLFLGNCQANTDDREAKGRGGDFQGEANGQAKLTEEEVREVRDLIIRGYSQRKIAKMYGVVQQTIGCINTGKSWAWLKGKWAKSLNLFTSP